jgi:mannosyltransferase OCH1-like enzyme
MKNHLVYLSILAILCLTVFSLFLYYRYSFDSIHFKNFLNKSQEIINQQIVIDKKKTPIIPLNIYQTWSTKQLPPNMANCVANMKKTNPEFKHQLFDDEDCRKFIQSNFDASVLTAFDKLIPGAYKADLWRCCILYKTGGIYVDIKFECTNGFKFIQLVDKEYLVLERSGFWKPGKHGIYNGVMICKKGSPILLDTINKIVKNVDAETYEYNPFYPTGPGLLGELYFNSNNNKYDDFELFYRHPNIVYKNTFVLMPYKEYREEQKQHQTTNHYMEMWYNKNIYKKSNIV